MYLIYGAGNAGGYYAGRCKEAKITEIEVTDSNPQLWGNSLAGYRILPPDEAFGKSYKYIIIAAESENYHKILEQICSHVKGTPIVSYGRTVVWDNEYQYDMGNIELTEYLENDIYLLEEFVSHVNQEKLNDLERFVLFEKHTRINKDMHYFEAYDRFFSRYRGRKVSILEIGVRGGGSVQMWKDYFGRNGGEVTVYGIDIDERCRQYEEENIKIYIGSQEDREFLRMVKEKTGKLDIIIDDGGHTMNQQIVSLEELWDCVKPGGIYLCEDVGTSYMASHGGSYKGENTFVEYSKNLIDYMNAEYSETNGLKSNQWTEEVKSVSYYNSMVFLEKCSRKNKAYDWIVE